MLAISLFLTLLLHETEIQIGNRTLTVEIADTPEARRIGLMGRKELSKDHGMLFVFDKEGSLSFWMKNTLIPLSIAFFDKEKRLIEILDMPVSTTSPLPLFKSSRSSLYALEVPMGWFEEKGICQNDSNLKFSFLDQEFSVK